MVNYINELYDREIASRKQLESFLIGVKKDHRVGSFFLGGHILAFCSFYLFNDIKKSKNFFYESALARTYYFEELNYDLFTMLSVPAPYLLCDSKKVIDKFCSLTDSAVAQKVGHIFYQMGKAVQYTILNNDSALESTIDMIKLRSKSGVGKNFATTIDFFEGILLKNEEKIFNGVNGIQKKLHRHQVILKDYFAIEATGLAKLAWLKGFEIDFKNKYIPQELLQVKPLEHYESYDFYN
jgi:hypothetical protein